ncbi:MAG: NADH-quinone oxidoreductase subunit L [Aquincola sp.]|nr:NADH-quinone oxidoreductase subunit L [Aquincola sp.]MDH5351550.1 NADH-quinone oxidoreductase subunit L [Betaproteobacteria bacterium]
MKTLYLLVPLAPLAGAILAGLFGRALGRAGAHTVTILGVLVSFLASCWIFADVLEGNTFNGTVYTWLTSGGVTLEIGFLIDRLSALMMVVVTFVSLMVHVYTIGYMAEDPGYQRFFSYISLFTFSMLMLVMANNFLQLFFGWEAVGLVSYLLIGFWYTRPTAIHANLKAFLVNRVGDFGFILGIALVLAYFGSLDYAQVFAEAPALAAPVTLICLALFVGAMGKSAQFPLHVWLPDSMEGPTPISALIHAATMVTAGIFMVARMAPLYELSATARSVVLVIGGITALFMGLVALTQYDIKRVVAYSTLSQLGYMTVALGASAYSAAIFHLMTHAFFKAVLFLGAGSVIIALHHEQDMRRMGGLKAAMPVTYWTFLLGAISSAGIPGFAGFFSKDAIIEAARHATIPGAGFAYLCVLACVFVTAAYTFRMVFMAFHGAPRYDAHRPPHESPAVVTVPLVLLAIPSVLAGWLVGRFLPVDSAWDFVVHGLVSLPFWLALAGIAAAAILYRRPSSLPKRIAMRLGPLYAVVERKYGFDELYAWLFGAGARVLGTGLWKAGDQTFIDGLMVNGSARVVGWFSGIVRLAQTGILNTYAFLMLFGILAGVTWVIWRFWS